MNNKQKELEENLNILNFNIEKLNNDLKSLEVKKDQIKEELTKLKLESVNLPQIVEVCENRDGEMDSSVEDIRGLKWVEKYNAFDLKIGEDVLKVAIVFNPYHNGNSGADLERAFSSDFTAYLVQVTHDTGEELYVTDWSKPYWLSQKTTYSNIYGLKTNGEFKLTCD